jgi:L-iditol 2-dehydrogenase
MRSVYVKAPFQFEMREEPTPTPGVNQVLVRVAYCGICGSDLTIARTLATDWMPVGHEVSGTVEAVGAGVRHVATGDRVALDCGNSCGVCPACRAGHPRRCAQIRGFYGTRSGFAEFLVADAQNVHPVGDLDLKTASLLEPFGVAMNLFRSLEIDFLDDVLLIGPGPIGLLALAACKARGARSLTAVARRASVRLEIAAGLGARTAVTDDPAAAFPDGFDKVIVTAAPETLPAALAACRTNGIIAYCGLGAAGQASVALDWDAVHGKNVQIRPMGDTPSSLPQAIELLRRGVLDANALITHTFPKSELPAAFALNEAHRDAVGKVVIAI